MNTEKLVLNSADAYASLAHEYQHLVQWYLDSDEDSWGNEGLSVLAEADLAFVPTTPFTERFLAQPQT